MHKKLRLKSPKDFARLRLSGHTRRHPLCRMSYAPNEYEHNRYGLITSKQLGNAVTRNRIRRQLREALRSLHPQIKTSYDIVIIAQSSMVGQPYSSITNVLIELFQRSDLFISPPETLT